ncbi:MAG: DNA polymerase III subunit gamma/tau [Phycisphaerae bacterium]|nr:DNA polymerase III subunit gamma/tau [Phycisphaerae bacterium]
MAYLVLARKYRSRTFAEVIGQEHVARTLTRAIEAGRVAHAYLFTGTRGVGKTTMARILAKALNCQSVEEPTPEPCNDCETCTAIGRGDDIDVVEIDGASNTGVDDVRELRSNAIYRPARSRYKIYYIDEVHMLSTAAFNALLKTLEEPPEHVKFIFSTTEVAKIPATILSRCQRFDFRNIPTDRIAEHLRSICAAESVQVDDDAIFRIARAAAGSMRDGVSLLDQLLSSAEQVTDEAVVRVLGTPADERVLAIVAAVAAGDAPAALGELATVLDSGVTLPSATTAVGEAFRHLLLASTCGPDSRLIELPESQRQQVAELTEQFSVPTLVYALGMLQTLERNVRSSSVGRGLIEAALVRLAAADQFVDPGALLERLEALADGNRPAQLRGGARPARTGQAPGRAQKKKPPLTGAASDEPAQSAPAGVTPQPASRGAAPPTTPTRVQPDESASSGADTVSGDAGIYMPQPAAPKLTTAERNAIANDPAVREVTDLFGGRVVDIRREAPPAEPTEGDTEDTDPD